MGQYHKTYNLDKKQFINPHKLGDGLKLLEQCGWSPGGTNDALHMLLACCSGRGGGDFQSDDPVIGSWAGDRIAVIGDYAEPDDIPGFNAQEIYGSEEYADITDQLIPILEREYECVYVGKGGYASRIQFSQIEGFSGSHGIGDRMIIIAGGEYLSSEVVKALKKYYKDEYAGSEKVTVKGLGLKPVRERA